MNNLLIIEDDELYAQLLKEKFLEIGWGVAIFHGHQPFEDALVTSLKGTCFTHCLLDLNLSNQTGLTLIPKILEHSSNCKIVVLTGFSSVHSSIEAIKLGAVYLLSKPTRFQAILDAFDHKVVTELVSFEKHPAPADMSRLEWEIIQNALKENQFNISKTAQQLGLHRRTLQRKLKKNIT